MRTEGVFCAESMKLVTYEFPEKITFRDLISHVSHILCPTFGYTFA